MNELINFLTSEEIMVVYIVIGLACVLCFIIYLVEKNTDKRKRRSNTRELNKLVEQIQEEVGEENEVNYSDEPVLETIEEVKPEADNAVVVPERVEKEPEQIEEKLEYTTIEPDQATAKLELQKLREELEKAQEENTVVEEVREPEIINSYENLQQVSEPELINNYEDLQEESAIISLEELVKKSKELYENNEKTQYIDDNTVPISLDELARQAGKTGAIYTENFEISDAVNEVELNDNVSDVLPVTNNVVAEVKAVDAPTVMQPATNKVVLEDFSSVKVPLSNESKTYKFKSSPIISPIYGIENKEKDTDIELENTANYEKLDQEIKKTNEFLMTLRELQKKLD